MNKSIGLLALSLMCVSVGGCKVRQTQEGQMPEVHATGGQLPAYDVKGPDVQVTSKPATVDVPVVKVHPPK